MSMGLVATMDQKNLINEAVTSSGDVLFDRAFRAAVLPTNNMSALPESASWLAIVAVIAALAPRAQSMTRP